MTVHVDMEHADRGVVGIFHGFTDRPRSHHRPYGRVVQVVFVSNRMVGVGKDDQSSPGNFPGPA